MVLSLAELYRPAIADWVTRDPDQIGSRLRIGGAAVAVALALPLLGVATYLWRLGDRIVRSGRFPAPGMAVARDTVVQQGLAARSRGRVLQFLAATLVLAAAGIAIVLWRIVSLAQ